MPKCDFNKVSSVTGYSSCVANMETGLVSKLKHYLPLR